MTITDLIDCVRVTFAFLVVFGAVPCLVARISPGDRNLMSFCALAVRTSLFAAIAALGLGSMRICLPGSMLAGYLFLFLMLLWMAGSLEPLRQPQWRAALLHKILVFNENGYGTPRRLSAASGDRLRHWRIVREPAFLLSMFIAVAALSHSLQYVRFLNDQSYSRALSLQKLALGQPWTPDGSVAFLAPVVFLSSLDGATVVRFSGPLFMAVLALAGFAAVRGATGSSPVGLAAAAGLIILTAFSHSAELQAGGIALIFWLTGFSLWARYRWDALWSVALAMLIEPIPELNTVLCVSVILVIVFLARFGEATRRLLQASGTPLATAAIVCLILIPLHRGKTHGSQYNITARTVARITREFPRNTWLVVSPVQEVALTYGHGWHMELSEFVETYTVDEVRRPDFSFKFPVGDTFVFVEKEPLTSRSMASGLSELGPRFDPPMAPYLLRLNRASMQFQAARLLAAYRATHRGTEVFLEDQQLIVYRIRG